MKASDKEDDVVYFSATGDDVTGAEQNVEEPSVETSSVVEVVLEEMSSISTPTTKTKDQDITMEASDKEDDVVYFSSTGDDVTNTDRDIGEPSMEISAVAALAVEEMNSMSKIMQIAEDNIVQTANKTEVKDITMTAIYEEDPFVDMPSLPAIVNDVTSVPMSDKNALKPTDTVDMSCQEALPSQLPEIKNIQAATGIKDEDPETSYEESHSSTNLVVKEETLDFDEEMENSKEPKNAGNPPERNENRCPIVYTTKLDEMLIFKKKFNSLEVDDIVDNIILESKPKFEKLPNQNINTVIHFINPFFKLVDNIRKFNEHAKETAPRDFYMPLSRHSSNQNNSVGKQLRVVLEECKVKPGQTVKVRYAGNRYIIIEERRRRGRPKKYIADSISAVDKGLIVDDPELGKEKARTKKTNDKKIKKGVYAHIIFFNREKKTTDIYFFNKLTNLTGYICRNYLIGELEMPMNSIVMYDCCWFGREAKIKSIKGLTKIWKESPQMLHTMSHTCLPGKCICCCKNKPEALTAIHVTSEEVPNNTIDVKKPKWFENIIFKRLQGDENNCISKALNYTRNIKCTDIPAYRNKKIKSVDVTIRSNYTDTIETYNIDDDGNIKRHSEVKIGDYSENDSAHSEKSQDITEVCCWVKRVNLLKIMQSKYSCSQINLMRIPHNCQGVISGEECTCCCRFTKSDATLALNYPPKQFKHSINYYSEKLVFRKKHCKKVKTANHEVTLKKFNDLMIPPIGRSTLKIPSKSPTLPTPPLAQRKTALQLPSSSSRANIPLKKLVPRPPSLSKLPASNQNEQLRNLPDMPSLSPIEHNPGVAQTNPGPSKSQNVVDSQNQDATVNSIVEKVLERFRDVRLTITPDGEVSAELHIPIQSLSTAELKILHAILAHAKEQVKNLKSSPGTHSLFTMFPNTIGIANGMSKLFTPVELNAPVPKTPAGPPIMNAPNLSRVPQYVPVAGPSNAPLSAPLPPLYNAPKTSVMGKALVATSNLSPNVFRQPLNSLTIHPQSISELPHPNMTNPYLCYTRISAIKGQQLIQSCKSFMINKAKKTVPKITNVFSLSQTDSNISLDKGVNTVQTMSSNRKRRSVNPKKAAAQNTNTYEGAESTNSNTKKTKSSRTQENTGTSMDTSAFSINPEDHKLTDSRELQYKVPINQSTLQDLVSSPFVPPPYTPLRLHQTKPALTANHSTQTFNSSNDWAVHPISPFPNLSIGPAFSLVNNVEITQNDDHDDNSILGF